MEVELTLMMLGVLDYFGTNDVIAIGWSRHRNTTLLQSSPMTYP